MNGRQFLFGTAAAALALRPATVAAKPLWFPSDRHFGHAVKSRPSDFLTEVQFKPGEMTEFPLEYFPTRPRPTRAYLLDGTMTDDAILLSTKDVSVKGDSIAEVEQKWEDKMDELAGNLLLIAATENCQLAPAPRMALRYRMRKHFKNYCAKFCE